MQHLHEVFSEDVEIATLYALSLLGTVRPGDKGFGLLVPCAAAHAARRAWSNVIRLGASALDGPRPLSIPKASSPFRFRR